MKSATVKAIERIEREFHQRAFGEELTRVNALPLRARLDYVRRLKERARARRPPSARGGGSAARMETPV